MTTSRTTSSRSTGTRWVPARPRNRRIPPMISLARSASRTIRCTAAIASASSRRSPVSQRRHAWPFATSAASGWFTSWAIEVASSPSAVARVTCARSFCARTSAARASLRSVTSSITHTTIASERGEAVATEIVTSTHSSEPSRDAAAVPPAARLDRVAAGWAMSAAMWSRSSAKHRSMSGVSRRERADRWSMACNAGLTSSTRPSRSSTAMPAAEFSYTARHRCPERSSASWLACSARRPAISCCVSTERSLVCVASSAWSASRAFLAVTRLRTRTLNSWAENGLVR